MVLRIEFVHKYDERGPLVQLSNGSWYNTKKLYREQIAVGKRLVIRNGVWFTNAGRCEETFWHIF